MRYLSVMFRPPWAKRQCTGTISHTGKYISRICFQQWNLLVRCLSLSSQDCWGVLTILAGFPESEWFRRPRQKLQRLLWPGLFNHTHHFCHFFWSHRPALSKVTGVHTTAGAWGSEDHCGPSWSLTTIGLRMLTHVHLRNHHHKQETEQFHHLSKNPCVSHCSDTLSPPLTCVNHWSITIVLSFGECHINGIIQYVAFWNGFFHSEWCHWDSPKL